MRRTGTPPVQILGIDWSTSLKQVALAVATAKQPSDKPLLRVELVYEKPVSRQALVAWVAACIELCPATLLALDAPLGWPRGLSLALHQHRAGAPLMVSPQHQASASELFRRETDVFVTRTLQKSPLEVGANYIARTAHAALQFLEEVRQQTGYRLPLAWHPAEVTEPEAIEIYPAATLKTLGLEYQGYKGNAGRAVRTVLVDQLAPYMALPEDAARLLESDHVLDACVAALAGWHFLAGWCHPPLDLERAHTEGWIWFLDPQRCG